MENSIKKHVVNTYRKRAGNYDFTANLYYLFGYREWAYRRSAVKKLKLQPGDTVLELACGTGLNFPLYQKYIGPSGRIIGVDITDAMLDQAQKRVAKAGWENVTLLNQDASFYEPDSKVNAVISTYALSLIPNIPQVIFNIEKMLATNGRLAILELQIPNTWPNWFSALVVNLMKPFAITDEWLVQRPWESIVDNITDLFDGVEISQHYFSLGYIISGQKRLQFQLDD
ncbi:methyltransferase domain-containing protein [bacterium]|nr:methyltransferase domain-containing protein [bacterium]